MKIKLIALVLLMLVSSGCNTITDANEKYNTPENREKLVNKIIEELQKPENQKKIKEIYEKLFDK